MTRKPEGVDHVLAAALPLAALTAHQVLIDTAQSQPGQRVLVHAGAGGVGHLAVQIAKAHGAHVIGTASAAKHDLVRAFGADEVIDYQTADSVELVEEVDAGAGEVRSHSLEVLRLGGVLVPLVADGGETEDVGVPPSMASGWLV